MSAPMWNGLTRKQARALRDSIEKWLADVDRESRAATIVLWEEWDRLPSKSERRMEIIEEIRALNEGRLIRGSQVVLADGLPAYFP